VLLLLRGQAIEDVLALLVVLAVGSVVAGAIAYNAFVVCSQSVVDQGIIERLGTDRQKPGNAWSAIIEAGSGRLIAGPLAADEEGIVYGEIDLNAAAPHYFIHEGTGHYWPKQFRVFFDDRELKPLTIEHPQDKELE